ncbi:MAG: hypothetical protein QM773_03065 [Hyphomonadaceae bacterium]
MTGIVRMGLAGLFAAVLAACSGGVALTGADDKVVVLTVTGAIGNSNRGPVDDFKDAFLAHKNVRFDRAYEFTRASLAALGEREMTVKRAPWPKPVVVRGPAFRDVMKAVKAEGSTVLLQALDGYELTFPVEALKSGDVILALEADGEPLSIGGMGPLWLVFPPGVVPGDDRAGDAGLAWSVFHITLK